ncbi:MAG: hypothetical protein Q9162_007258 [Coniocarpon cinnabarinum]
MASQLEAPQLAEVEDDTVDGGVETYSVDGNEVGLPVDEPPVQRQLRYGKESKHRSFPMKVIVVGMPGTNGPAMAKALKQLGIPKIFDTQDLLDPRLTKFHKRLIQMQMGETRKQRKLYFTADDFDPLLESCEAVLGWPAATYATDLMIAYRDAKVIVTTLPSSAQSAWKKKLESTYNALQSSILIKCLLWFDISHYRSTHNLLMTTFKTFFDGDLSRNALMSYKIHTGRINGTINLQHRDGNADLLMFDPSNGDWHSLCAFLQVPEPKAMPFPRVQHHHGPGNALDADPAFKQLAPWRLFIRYSNYHILFSLVLSYPLAFALGPRTTADFAELLDFIVVCLTAIVGVRVISPQRLEPPRLVEFMVALVGEIIALWYLQPGTKMMTTLLGIATGRALWWGSLSFLVRWTLEQVVK